MVEHLQQSIEVLQIHTISRAEHQAHMACQSKGTVNLNNMASLNSTSSSNLMVRTNTLSNSNIHNSNNKPPPKVPAVF